MTPEPHDVAVVGAGPAGLGAAAEAAGAGLDVVLIDAGQRPGGQYWRHAEGGRGQHWKAYEGLSRRLGQVRRIPGTQVWLITRDQEGFTLRLTGHDPVTARAVILCPGGYDRQLPIPGWDLPGVMAAGGVQALLKEHGTAPGRRAVVAGTGPFLLPVAVALARAGVAVAAVAEANPVTGWLRDPFGALAAPSKSVEAVRYAAAMTARRVLYRTRTVITEIVGDGRAEAVRLRRADGTQEEIAADLVALGWGFTPSLELPIMLGAETRLDEDGSLVAVVDGSQRSTADGVYIAGEATGVGGAALALAEGRLAALTLAGSGKTARLRRAVRRGRRFAAAMRRACPVPAEWTAWLTESTVVCRCEEVPYGELRRACHDLGADDARAVKMLARPGMGWCQGRMCGFATAAIAARLNGRVATADDLRAFAARVPAFPVALEDLAEN
ncbi:FAD-dependent oxidoreductase [Streptosporangiaceae bacterium NEAU-GS5]|nr:FAD-dependent oxidoreductase [Streptosporangiaceae bacterium NEAU-GS5]